LKKKKTKDLVPYLNSMVDWRVLKTVIPPSQIIDIPKFSLKYIIPFSLYLKENKNELGDFCFLNVILANFSFR
jgi:hypothetical protein